MDNPKESENMDNSKESEKSDLIVSCISFLYLVVLIIILVSLVISLSAKTPESITKVIPIKEGYKVIGNEGNFLKSGVATLITLVFGTASKSLYRFFLYVPYDFDEDLFEKKKENKKMRLITELFADIFMGGSLCLYIMKIAPMPSTWVFIVIFFILIIISLILVLIHFIKPNKN